MVLIFRLPKFDDIAGDIYFSHYSGMKEPIHRFPSTKAENSVDSAKGTLKKVPTGLICYFTELAT